MRYDRIVVFVQEGKPVYNESTGNYKKEIPVRVERIANITSTGLNHLNMLYGKVIENSLTVRVKTPYKEDFDYMEIDGKPYEVTMSRLLSQEQTFYVTERQ